MEVLSRVERCEEIAAVSVKTAWQNVQCHAVTGLLFLQYHAPVPKRPGLGLGHEPTAIQPAHPRLDIVPASAVYQAADLAACFAS